MNFNKRSGMKNCELVNYYAKILKEKDIIVKIRKPKR